MYLRPLLSLLMFLGISACSDLSGPKERGPYGLWIRETGLVLEPGGSVTLTARMQERGSSRRTPGSSIDSVVGARWWTDNESVLRVADPARGTVEALAPGRAAVWVEVGSRRDSANVTVLAAGDVPTHRWKAVAASGTGTCALDVQGHAFCWGDDSFGGWGTGGDRRQWTNAYRPARVNSTRSFEEIGRGIAHACARTAGGEVWCWGLHNTSHLGHGRTSVDYETAPVRVDFPGRATALTVGAQHACLLDEQGRAHCWGSNLGSQLGVGMPHIFSSAERGGRTVPVAFNGTFETIDGTRYHTCGLTAERELYCWGRTYGGAPNLGLETSVPTRITTPVSPRQLSTGDGGSCFLSDSSEMYCWGTMQLPPTGYQQIPARVEIGNRFTQLATVCGLEAGGVASCWGVSHLDRFDPAAATEPCGSPAYAMCSGTPVRVPGNHRFVTLSVGLGACGITESGELYCWGDNEWGQLGNGRLDVKSTHIPQRVLDPN